MIVSVAVALLLTASVAAWAADDDGEALRLEPVTVSAEKRTQEAQDIPASMTVLEESDIRDMGIEDTSDLAEQVPNLEFNDVGSRRHGLMFLRGIKSLPTGEPATGFYVDDVNYSKSYMFNFPLFDVERIEVLKGPQGTLYGRNSIGGVINVHTRQPGNEVVANVGTTIANFDRKELRGSWSGPIIEDKLFMGIYAMAEESEGYMKNDVDADGGDGRHTDGQAMRLKLRCLASQDWEINLTLDGQQHDDGAYPFRRTARNGLVKAGAFPEDDRYHYSHDYEGTQENDCWGATLTSKYETGIGTFHSITGFRDFDSDEHIDADFSPLDRMVKRYIQNDDNVSQEFRLVSPDEDGPFKWLAGTYFFHMDSENKLTNTFGADSPTPGREVYFKTNKTNSGAAAFGQGTYTFFDKLDLTLGLRFEYEHAEADSTMENTPSGGPTVTAGHMDGSQDFTAFLPKLALAWHFDGDHMAYGTVARAHRSGGFNDASAPAGKESFDEEDSWLYEVGVKSYFMDQRLMLNLSGFYTTIEDEQLPLFETGYMQSYTANAGKSHRMGLEMESRFKVAQGLDLSANFSWIQAEFDEYEDTVLGVDYEGNTIFCVPEYTYGLALDYRRPLNEDWGLFGRINLTGVGSRYFDDANNVKEDPYNLVNLRVGVEGEHLDCYLWAKNVFDEEYVLFENTTAGIAEDGAPRTFGITVDYRF